MGYYEIPKRITCVKLSKILGIGNSSLIEHLRKIER